MQDLLTAFIWEPLAAILTVLGILGLAGVGMVVLLAPIAALTRSARVRGRDRFTVGFLIGLGVVLWLAILVAAGISPQ